MSDRAFAERTARILGQASAAAKALSELRRRQDAGEDADIYFHPRYRTWLVGPRIAEET